jgi:hypothetical protein
MASTGSFMAHRRVGTVRWACGALAALMAVSACSGTSPGARSSASTPSNSYSAGGVASNRPTVPAGSLVPIVSYAGISGENLEVNAYFPVVDSGGMCSLQVGGQNFGNVPALADATSTWCDPLSAPLGDIGQGPWDIQVTYHSADHDAMSAKVKVEP